VDAVRTSSRHSDLKSHFSPRPSSYPFPFFRSLGVFFCHCAFFFGLDIVGSWYCPYLSTIGSFCSFRTDDLAVSSLLWLFFFEFSPCSSLGVIFGGGWPLYQCMRLGGQHFGRVPSRISLRIFSSVHFQVSVVLCHPFRLGRVDALGRWKRLVYLPPFTRLDFSLK